MARGRIVRHVIELDMLDPEGIRKTLKRQGIDMQVIDPDGPGGGCPVVRLTGTPTKLVGLCFARGYNEVRFVRNEVGQAS